MIDKSINGIHCGNLNVSLVGQFNPLNCTGYEFDDFTFLQTSGNYSQKMSFEETVCCAEIESQKLLSTIAAIMAPIGDLTRINRLKLH